MKNKKLYFVTGSQDLYGEDTLKQVDIDSKMIAQFLNSQPHNPVTIEYYGTVKNNNQIIEAVDKINYDNDCIGIICWCHTFSPAKMWINGLKKLAKPMLHLHTQANRELPYDNIDMDFMNLNQAAHGDREFGFIGARLRMSRKVLVGYYQDEQVLAELFDWAQVAVANDYSKQLKVCRFGDNMRDVAVTEGDKVEAQIKFGWQVNYYGIGDLVAEIAKVTDSEVDAEYSNALLKYELNTTDITAVKEQIKYKIAIKSFLDKGNYKAFTTNFQDLHGLKQLPGLAVQMLMAEGYGFGGEGDWKTSALGTIMQCMASTKAGATGFMEDYTYDLTSGEELVLGAHMLEVSPQFASTKPKIEVHPLGIGDKEPPARLVFDGCNGDGIAVTMVDMGGRYRLIVAEIKLVKQPKVMPKLPVARVMWKLKPNLKTGAAAWIYAGGAHHTVVSTALTTQSMLEFAKMQDIECVVIDSNTNLNALQKELAINDIIWEFKR